jgi:hypothetical protein
LKGGIVLKTASVVIGLLLVAGGANRAGGQGRASDTVRVSGVHPKYFYRVCDAAEQVRTAGLAVKAALAEDDSLTKAHPEVARAVPAALRKPMRDASAEFDVLFDALDEFDAAWGAVILDLTDGKASMALPFSNDTVPEWALHPSNARDQHAREARAGQADMFGLKLFKGFTELVDERCTAPKAGAGK